MAQPESTEDVEIDNFDGTPEELRDNDEITDAEEAFLEGFESTEEEEEEKEEEPEDF